MRKHRRVRNSLVAIWLFGWLPIDIVLGALTTPCDSTGACGLNSNASGWVSYKIFLAAWFGIVLVPAAIVVIVKVLDDWLDVFPPTEREDGDRPATDLRGGSECDRVSTYLSQHRVGPSRGPRRGVGGRSMTLATGSGGRT